MSQDTADIDSIDGTDSTDSTNSRDTDNTDSIRGNVGKTVCKLNPLSKLFNYCILPILATASVYFIHPSKMGSNIETIYWLAYIVFVSFTLYFIWHAMGNFNKIHNLYENVGSDIKTLIRNAKGSRLSSIAKAYKASFAPGYNKTLSNADLFFGFIPCMQDMDGIPLLNLLRLIPGTYIGFGILGTFIGFSSGLTGINIADSDDLLAGVQALIMGLKTAFNTSIVGVVMSIILNFLVIHYILGHIESLCKALCDQLDINFQITEVDMMGIKDQDGNIMSFPNILCDIQAQIQELKDGMSINTEEGETVPFSGVLEQILDKLDRQQEHLLAMEKGIEKQIFDATAMGDQIVKSVQDGIEKSVKATIGEEIEKIKEELKSTILVMHEIQTGLQIAPNNLRDSMSHIESFIKNLGSFTNSLNDIREAMASLTKDFGGIRDSISTTSATTKKIQEGFSRSMAGLNDSINKAQEINNAISLQSNVQAGQLTQTMDKFSALIKEYNSIKGETLNVLEGFKTMGDEVRNSFKDVNDKAKQYGEIISTSLDSHFKTFSDTAAKQLEGIQYQAVSMLDSFKAIGDTMRTNFDEVNNKAKQYGEIIATSLDSHFKTFNDATVKKMDELKAETNHSIYMLQAVQEGLKGTPDSIESAANKIEDFSTKLNEIGQSIESTTNKTIEAQEGLKSALESASTSLEKSREASESFNSGYKAQVEQLNTLVSSLDNMFKKYKATNDEATKVLQGFKTMDSDIGKVFTQINEKTEAYTKVVASSLNDYLKQFASSSSGITVQLTTAVNDLRDTIKDIKGSNS